IELADEQHSLAHRQPSVEPAATNGRDRLADAGPVLPQDLAGFGIEREDVIVPGADIHDAVFDERRRLERILTAKSGALEAGHPGAFERSEEHTSELQSPCNIVCRLLLEKKNLPRRALLSAAW